MGKNNYSVDVSDILNFVCLGDRKGESEAPGGGGGQFFLEEPRGGGVSWASGGVRRPEGCLRAISGGRGGWWLIFFWGPKFPPRSAKKIRWSPPHVDCNYPVDVSRFIGEMSRLSCGQSVQSVWVCTEVRSGRPGCPRDLPPSRLGDTSDSYRPANCS